MLRKRSNKLGRLSYKLKDNPSHTVHAEHKAAVRTYSNTLKSTKKHHWRDWLERAEDPDIWTVHRLITSPATNGGKSCIPGVKYKDSTDGDEKLAASNTEKSEVLAKCFFPSKPSIPPSQSPATAQQEADIEALDATREQVLRQLRRLKPYKAPGPNGIPNVVLTKCVDIIVDRLLDIYSAMLELNCYDPDPEGPYFYFLSRPLSFSHLLPHLLLSPIASRALLTICSIFPALMRDLPLLVARIPGLYLVRIPALVIVA